jgi:hypothetical protein
MASLKSWLNGAAASPLVSRSLNVPTLRCR